MIPSLSLEIVDKVVDAQFNLAQNNAGFSPL
jgi:hypothetical protein